MGYVACEEARLPPQPAAAARRPPPQPAARHRIPVRFAAAVADGIQAPPTAAAAAAAIRLGRLLGRRLRRRFARRRGNPSAWLAYFRRHGPCSIPRHRELWPRSLRSGPGRAGCHRLLTGCGRP